LELKPTQISTRTSASIRHVCPNKRHCGVEINLPSVDGFMIWVTFLSQNLYLLFSANRKPVNILSPNSLFNPFVSLTSSGVKLFFKYLAVTL